MIEQKLNLGIDEEIIAKKIELKQLKAERKNRKQAEALENRKQRANRDLRLKGERDLLNAVKQCIFDYNKLGKAKKEEFNLVGELKLIINSLEEEDEWRNNKQDG